MIRRKNKIKPNRPKVKELSKNSPIEIRMSFMTSIFLSTGLSRIEEAVLIED
jgi:hypothetical protein